MTWTNDDTNIDVKFIEILGNIFIVTNVLFVVDFQMDY